MSLLPSRRCSNTTDHAPHEWADQDTNCGCQGADVHPMAHRDPWPTDAIDALDKKMGEAS